MGEFQLTPRVRTLIDRLLSSNSAICSERASIMAELNSGIAGMPHLVKRASVFNELVRRLPLYIGQDELIVGSQASRARLAVFHSESELKEPSVFSFLADNVSVNGKSCLSPNYMAVLEKGFVALKIEAENNLRNSGSSVNRSELDKINFWKAATFACDAALALAERLSNKATELAAVESNPYRKNELLEIAQIFRKVPACPAQTFKEACQAFYLFQLLLQLDNGDYAVSPVGFDKALFNYYKRDIDSGQLTREKAYEVVEC
ncbi:MAG: pyruvate formate lyase family protein, partial [Enterobacteriaceae bacterium]